MSSQPTELVSIREIQKYFAYDSIKEFSAGTRTAEGLIRAAWLAHLSASSSAHHSDL